MIGRLQHASQLPARRVREPMVLASAEAELLWATRAVAPVKEALPARLDGQVELTLLHVAELARNSPSE
jgi:hypothetical protein